MRSWLARWCWRASWPAFYCGMVPLGLDALAMAFVTWRLVP
ncbi:hypothetical protein [Selenomonas sp.]|nr:hypothetical protein [Selenomonas sp.]